MKNQVSSVLTTGLLLLLCFSNVHADALYNITIFEPQIQWGYATYCGSINDYGIIVGSTSTETDDGWQHKHATLFDYTGNDVDLLPGRQHSEAHAVNNNGTIVGESNNVHAVVFDAGGGINIDIGEGYAYAANANEQIVGRKRVSGVSKGAFIWDVDNGMQEFAWGDSAVAWGINDFGGVVGLGQISGELLGATFFDPRDGGKNIYLGGGQAHDINNQWEIVGHSYFDGDNHATLFDATGGTNNINLGGENSEAYAINNDGQIVGWYNPDNPSHDHHAMFFDPSGNGDNIDLNTVIDPSYSGPYLRLALDINNNGWIVGVAGSGANERGFLLTPIPEPTTLSLLALGFLTLLRRHKK